MPQVPHRLHWRELTRGLIGVAVIVALALIVLVFARVGALHGKKVTLYVVTDEIAGMVPEFNALGAATRELAAKVRQPIGTLGNIHSEGLPDFTDISAGFSSLNARARGNGTFARLTRGNLRTRASRAMAAA